MSVHCKHCGAVAGYGHTISHKVDCPQSTGPIFRHEWQESLFLGGGVPIRGEILPPPEQCVQFHDASGAVVFTIRPNGRIERGPAFTTVDEASLLFWDAIEKSFGKFLRRSAPAGGVGFVNR